MFFRKFNLQFERKCKNTRLISRYLDKELDKGLYDFLERHIKECSDCSREYNELSGLKQLFLKRKEKKFPQDYLVFCLREKINLSRKITFLESLNFLSKKFLPVPICIFILVLIFTFYSLKNEYFYNFIDDEEMFIEVILED